MTNTAANESTLSIAEMVRVLDVASEVRRTESLLERQWNVDVVRKDLREKLLATSKTTGEGLTPAQVDAAIDWYYDRLHRFKKPKKSVGYYLAHVYVRRGRFMAWLLTTGFVAWLLWFLAACFIGERPVDGDSTRSAFIEEVNDVEAMMKLDDARVPIKRWKRLAATGNVPAAMKTEIQEIRDTLTRQYGIVITDWFPERRGLEIDWDPYPMTPGMENGRYVLMEVEGGDGRGVGVTDARSNERKEVQAWCQAIPMAVRDRDQVHASRYFAYKYPGLIDLEVVLEGVAGLPVEVGPQLHVDTKSMGSRL